MFPTILPESLSPSQLATWQTCETKWHYSYVEGLKAYSGYDEVWYEKGSYIHELLHLYYNLLASGYELGDPILLSTIKDRITSDVDETEELDMSFFNDVVQTTFAYIKERSPVIDRNIDFDTVLVEHHLKYKMQVSGQESIIPNRLLHGFADLIYWDKVRKCWIIRDHKTGGQDSFSRRATYRTQQLKFYAMLWWLTSGGVIPMVEISWIRSNRPKDRSRSRLYALYTVQHKEAPLEAFFDYVETAHIRQAEMIPVKNYGACTRCPYFPICDRIDKNVSVEFIKRGNYYAKSQVHAENSRESNEDQEDDSPTLSWG